MGRGPFRVDFFLFFSLSQKIDAWKIQRRLVDRQGGGRRRRAGGALSSLILSRACASPGRCLRASLRALRGKERQRGKAKEGESQSEQKNFISLSSLFSLLLIQHERPPFLFVNKEKRIVALVLLRVAFSSKLFVPFSLNENNSQNEKEARGATRYAKAVTLLQLTPPTIPTLLFRLSYLKKKKS